ncbi:tenascin-like protein [Achlya hypogyna]|uniref:Tenascin-like protein n=1 Tax=Achlya hypogyna TaxID=1202772 RepID=A0A1V9YVD8_ACHHY|nr:tenascin-like protein [Achlya hypogyna]
MSPEQTEEIQLVQCTASYLRHQVILNYDAALSAGTFVLNFGIQRTDPIAFNAPAANALGSSMTEMLQALSMIPAVTVTTTSTATATTWDVVFPPTASEQHIFRPTWRVVEVQRFFCAADSGFLTLTYAGRAFPNIPFSALATELRTTLQAYYKFGAVTVTYSQGTTLCNALGNYVTIAFDLMRDRNYIGDLPPLLIDGTNQNQPNGLAWGTKAAVVDAQTTEIVKGIDTCNVVEVQSISCCATSGFFAISFEGRTVSNIPFGVAATDLRALLLAGLPQLLDIDVTYSAGTAACSLVQPANVITINFAVVTTNGPLGNGVLSLMTADRTNGGVSGLLHSSPNLLLLSATATEVVRGARCVPLSAGYTSRPSSQIVSNVVQGGGAFTVSFRQATTLPISATASAADVANALLRLPTIAGIIVTFTSGEACSTPGNVIRLNFTQDFGRLPSVAVLNAAGSTVGINVYTGGAVEPVSGLASAVVAGFTYGSDPNNPVTWDATKIQSCLCDPIYTGYDCSRINCPHGDDPNTYLDVMEVQYVQCTATGGSFTLTFRSRTTSPISWNADAMTVQWAVNSITSGVSVTFDSTNTAACSSSGVVIGITFLLDYGALPCIVTDAGMLQDNVHGTGQPGTGTVTVACGGAAVAGATSVVGTRENALCSNHGVCDFTTGVCTCDPFFASSDGLGGPGTRGDCGYRTSFH